MSDDNKEGFVIHNATGGFPDRLCRRPLAKAVALVLLELVLGLGRCNDNVAIADPLQFLFASATCTTVLFLNCEGYGFECVFKNEKGGCNKNVAIADPIQFLFASTTCVLQCCYETVRDRDLNVFLEKASIIFYSFSNPKLVGILLLCIFI